MDAYECAILAANEVKDILKKVDSSQLHDFAIRLDKAKRIFVSGAGRSLLMLRAFAMRLMHLGYTVHVVSDTTTPAIEAQDILIVGSASGETSTLKVIAGKAVELGAQLNVLTANPESSLGKLADHIVEIPASTHKVAGPFVSGQLGGSSFEQSMLLLLDGVALYLADIKKDKEPEKLKRHANLE